MSAHDELALSSDCGCGKGAAQPRLEAASDVPSLQELEAALEAAAAEPGVSGDAEVDLAALDELLASDEFELAAIEAGPPSLDELIRLAERYPGLKVTLSF